MRVLLLMFCAVVCVSFIMLFSIMGDAIKSAETMGKNSEIACKACVDKGGIPIMDGLRMKECIK